MKQENGSDESNKVVTDRRDESRALIEMGPAETQVATFAYHFGNTTRRKPSKNKQTKIKTARHVCAAEKDKWSV